MWLARVSCGSATVPAHQVERESTNQNTKSKNPSHHESDSCGSIEQESLSICCRFGSAHDKLALCGSVLHACMFLVGIPSDMDCSTDKESDREIAI